jgi:hypothetical protein
MNVALFPVAAVVRVAGWLLKARSSGGLDTPPEPINGALRRLFAAERRWLAGPAADGRFPFGLSLLAVARRPA